MNTYLENFFCYFVFHVVKGFHVLFFNKLVAIHTTGLVQPEANKVKGCFEALRTTEEEALEDIGEVTQVEDVVKFDGRGEECRGYLLVELEGTSHDLFRALLNMVLEAVQQDVLRKNAVVDGLECIHT